VGDRVWANIAVGENGRFTKMAHSVSEGKDEPSTISPHEGHIEDYARRIRNETVGKEQR